MARFRGKHSLALELEIPHERQLTFADRLTGVLGGPKIYLKREDLCHTGAHKINNTIGQILLARRMGKTRIIAEPGALIGFAGPRVIEQTIGQELPEGFQRSEFLLEHGMVDVVVPRPELKMTVSRLLQHMVG